MDFSNQTAIITGASSGIGAAAAQAIARRGGRVVINYSKSEAAAKAVAENCIAAGGAAITVQADVSDKAQCKHLAAAALDHWGQIDIVVNNAGTTKFVDHDHLDGLDAQDFEHIYALNLIGAYQMISSSRDALARSENGAVVNISSVAGLRGIGSSVAYVASKGALNSMTLALARALGADDIRVNAVCPGFVGTDWFRNAFGDAGFEKIVTAQKSSTPLKRAGRPEDIEGAIMFFASLLSKHITGQLLAVDGGMLLGMPFKSSAP